MAFTICCITIAFLIAGNIYVGYKKPGFRAIKNTISELGETGSRYKKQVSLGLFLPAPGPNELTKQHPLRYKNLMTTRLF